MEDPQPDLGWSIDIQGESPFEVGSLVLRILQDRYLATIEDYDVTQDGSVSVSVGLPSDPWTRRIVLHWARVDRNNVIIERAHQVHAASIECCDRSRLFLEHLRDVTLGGARP